MGSKLQMLDGLRSTRTRIVKSSVSSAPRSSSASALGPRDFSEALGALHPLRVIFVGHNPSTASWELRAPYAHRSNMFWRLLADSGLVPPEMSVATRFRELPLEVGIGFVDLFVEPGSDARLVGGGHGEEEVRLGLCERVRSRTGGVAPKFVACVSKVVAGKFLKGWKGAYGAVGSGAQWGLVGGLEDSLVWVLPSSSGRAALKWVDRLTPYRQLADCLKEEHPWPIESVAMEKGSIYEKRESGEGKETE